MTWPSSSLVILKILHLVEVKTKDEGIKWEEELILPSCSFNLGHSLEDIRITCEENAHGFAKALNLMETSFSHFASRPLSYCQCPILSHGSAEAHNSLMVCQEPQSLVEGASNDVAGTVTG